MSDLHFDVSAANARAPSRSLAFFKGMSWPARSFMMVVGRIQQTSTKERKTQTANTQKEEREERRKEKNVKKKKKHMRKCYAATIHDCNKMIKSQKVR